MAQINYDLSVLEIEGIYKSKRNIILKILKSREGQKVCVFDPSLIKLFDYLAPFTLFKTNGVKHYYNTNFVEHQSHTHYIYFLRPTFENMKFLSQQESFIKDVSQCNTHDLYFIPTRRLIMEALLDSSPLHKSDIWEYVNVYDCDVSHVPIDYDLLSMELTYPNIIEEITQGDVYFLLVTAKNLSKLSTFSSIIAIGKYSEKIKTLLSKQNTHKIGPDVSNLIIIDRSVDLITPCLNQCTYHGMIDEVLGTQLGVTKVNGYESQLKSGCYSYSQIRDVSRSNVKPILNSFIRNCEISTIEKDATETEKQEYLRNSTNQLIELKYWKEHIEITQKLKSYITNAIYTKCLDIQRKILSLDKTSLIDIDDFLCETPPIKIFLQLFCLYCQVFSFPVKYPDEYSEFKNNIYNVYGYKHFITLNKLEKMGFLSSFSLNGHKYKEILNDLDLIVETGQSGIGSIYEGYVPLSYRLIEIAFRNNVAPTVICFVGGCTYGEIACCRLLSGNVIITTTHIINCNNLFDCI
jgi:hypothetical protein